MRRFVPRWSWRKTINTKPIFLTFTGLAFSWGGFGLVSILKSGKKNSIGNSVLADDPVKEA